MNNLLYYECVKNITASDGTAHAPTARPPGAQPLVLVHGLFGSGSNLGSLARLFIHERPVYLVDLPNHGRSPWITDTSYPTAAAFLHRTLQQISKESGGEELHVFGHSMGGKVVMALGLLQNPSSSPSQTQETEGDYRIASLIIGDIAPRRYDAGHNVYFNVMSEMPAVTSRKEADDYMAGSVENPVLRSFLLKNLERQHDGTFIWKLNLKGLLEGYSAILGWDITEEHTSHIPILFLRGTESEYIVPSRDRQLIWSYFSHARIENVSNSGHWIHTEQPAQVYELMNAFICG